MKAIRVTSYGSPDNMVLVDMEDPALGPDDVLLDIAAAAVNPIDWKIVSGAMQSYIPVVPPFTPGVDAAGTVVAVGRNVSTLNPGDEVMGFIGIVGAYATRAVVPASRLAPKPQGLSFIEAAAVPAAALTAWQGLHEQGEVRPGQKVLIHAAAGGVGSAAVQIAKLAGAHVIGTSSQRNHDYLRALGADEVIDYHRQDFTQRRPDIDMVFDLVGGETQQQSWTVLKDTGVLVSTVSRPEGSHVDAPNAVGKHFATRADGTLLAQIGQLYQAGKLRVSVESVFPLSRAAEAMEKVRSGHVQGKIVIDTTAA